MKLYPLAVLLAALLATASTFAAEEDVKLDEAAMKRWGGSQYVVIARLESAQAGPVGLSSPPVYTHRLTLVVEQVLRGPAKKGDTLVASHVARQLALPVFPVGKSCLVAGSSNRGTIEVKAIEEANQKNSAAAKQACSVPMGWTSGKDGIVSPWASLGKDAWPTPATTGLRCAVTGRPALLTGGGVTLSVTHVPPPVEVKWGNPDGDGEYTITVANTTDNAVEVPALLTDGKNILWDQSLVILCQNKVYLVPGSKAVTGQVKPARLEPKQSVSTTVNALKLNGPEWPKGGYRIEFQFCLGELSSTQSFYYLSKHHDAIRAKLMEAKK